MRQFEVTVRADKFFSEKYGSRTKAKEALERGEVLLNGKPLSYKAEVFGGEPFCFVEGTNTFVSNGGYKLERAIETFQEDVSGKVFADLGASTGGFTHCLLKRGAKKVYCVDVGESQLAEVLQTDSRVCVMDRTNARYLTAQSFPEQLDGVVSDLSFISLRLILPSVREILPEGGKAFVLFKPQFECEGRGIGKSGILPVRYHAPLLKEFYEFALNLSLAPIGLVNAPVREKKNIEYVVLLQKGGKAISQEEFLFRLNNFLSSNSQ